MYILHLFYKVLYIIGMILYDTICQWAYCYTYTKMYTCVYIYIRRLWKGFELLFVVIIKQANTPLNYIYDAE